MASIYDPSSGAAMKVDSYKGTAHVTILPEGAPHALTGISGIIAATTNGVLFAARLNPNLDNDFRVYIERLFISWTTLTAFTTAANIRSLLFGRSVANSGAFSGGTAVNPAVKDSADNISQISSGQGGDARIATTAALTAPSTITWDTNTLQVFDFAHAGAAGANARIDWNSIDGGGPIVLQPGQIFGIRTNGALDAAGTGVLTVVMEFVEGTI